METSDSEYFESADEDFESDYEESEKHQHVSLSDTNTAPELCKLSIEDKQENKGDITGNFVKEEISNDTNIALRNSNEKIETQPSKTESDNIKSLSTNSQTKIGETPKYTLESSKEKNYHLEPLNTPKHEDICNKPLHSSKNPEENPTKTKNSQEPIIPVLAEDKTHPLKNLDNKDSEIIKKKPIIEPEKEDNLWDDDEIDWGSEAVKEESQKTEEHSLTSKNEDSGWDDFDTEWESESPTSNQFENKKTQTKSTSIKAIASNTITVSQSNIKHTCWGDDDGWEPLEKPEEKLRESDSSWGGWGGWGVTSLLNTATQGMSSLTNQVSQGFSTVLEGGMGIPEPEEMAKINKTRLEKADSKEKENTSDKELDENSPTTPVAFGLGNLVSGVSQLTKFVESTGTKVITGGLDTLEAIGKKTVEVLQEGDPGLKKKRAFLKLDNGKPNLSQMLREAKERAEEENQELSQKQIEVRRVKNYEALFDDHHGLVHLEALEMLSKLCNIKLDNLNNSLSGDALKDMQETLDQVKELCELPEEEEDEKVSVAEAKEKITHAVTEISIPICYDKLFAVCKETHTWLENINLSFINDVELHQQALDTLAQLTALAVEQFHKAGELLLVKEHRSTADEADSLVQITATVKSLIISEAGKFTDKLSTIENLEKDKISEHITNIFYEAANSGTYIEDAFQLLIPVLQVGSI